ncbi:hypothetical protein [Gracilibacillus thailandensis]|uniref:DUF2971 domain-containing protein n=1 Tax=Gracilibacillus thailandensis TaxID=563735 RepID=A0A6N7R6I2_9BACI|nr:hypothetical protein [Gracilibacillus thailandensis]MRI68774.1 hypothetical protein [Gracilibacillus thailandensis]
MNDTLPNGFFLFKFVRKEHLEDFLSGNIYMPLSKYFIELEENQVNKGVGDKYEGSYISNVDPKTNKFEIEIEPGKFAPLNFTKAFHSYRYKGIENIPITCFTMIHTEDLEEVEKDIFAIKENVIQDLKQSGIFENRKAIFIDTKPFIDKFTTIINNTYSYKCASVKYFNTYQENNINKNHYDKNPFEALFYKRDIFASQREYRIILRHNFEEPPTIKIGDIRDICRVFDASTLRETFKIERVNKE